jgi:hypothetical protein
VKGQPIAFEGSPAAAWPGSRRSSRASRDDRPTLGALAVMDACEDVARAETRGR